MTYVKICGLTSLDDALFASESGADYLGFIFYAKSARAMTAETVAPIVKQLPRSQKTVGVFVDEHAVTIRVIRHQVKLTLVQLHGDEPIAMLSQVGDCYKAIRPVDAEEGLMLMESYTQLQAADLKPNLPDILIDAYHPTLYGGTGQRLDRELALTLNQQDRRVILAGGLTPDNVGDVIRAVRPFAVDVSSGVEFAPGKKDHGKVRAFIQAVREASID